MILPITCPIPVNEYPEVVLAHGGGGSLTQELIDRLFRPAFDNALLNAQHDGAIVDVTSQRIAFSTDSYVVRTNDIAMCGATPQYLSVALILEEGFSMAALWQIVQSMATAASESNVTVVTGDTKVVDKGSGDGIFINTSGFGNVPEHVNINPRRIQTGDAIILSGDVGRHGIAIMAAREDFDFSPPVLSDSCALNNSVKGLINAGIDLHCLRDATRGGIATTLIELAQASHHDMEIVEKTIPVNASIRAAAEVLGLDPLYIANEGRYLLVVAPEDEENVLRILASDPVTANACRIGTVLRSAKGSLSMITTLGTSRSLDRLSGEQLPRIC